MSVDDFFSRYWERAPLHISRGDAAYYGPLLGKSDIDRFIGLNEDALQYGTDLNVCRCEAGKVSALIPRRAARKRSALAVVTDCSLCPLPSLRT